MRELLPADTRALDEEQWCWVELVKQGVWHNFAFRRCPRFLARNAPGSANACSIYPNGRVRQAL
jgi:hypothetical protein